MTFLIPKLSLIIGENVKKNLEKSLEVEMLIFSFNVEGRFESDTSPSSSADMFS